MTDAILRDARTQEALRLAYQEQNRRDFFRVRDAVVSFAVQFATVDLPILAATTILSCGTLSAAAATWRVATGFRLASSVILAGEIAVSIPISQAIDRALGRSVDDSFTGNMRQAGLMLGTRIFFYTLGRVSSRLLDTIRGRSTTPTTVMPMGSRWGNIAAAGREIIAAMEGQAAGAPLTARQILVLKRNLWRQRIEVVTDRAMVNAALSPGARAGFSYTASGRMRIYLREDATRYEVLHEWLHSVHYRRNPLVYQSLSPLEREQYVFSRVRAYYWDTLTEAERLNAIANIEARFPGQTIANWQTWLSMWR